MLTDLKNRGLSDIFVACINGLTSFPDAIKTVYERTKVQFCVVHLVRAAMRYVTDEDCRPVAADLKKIWLHPEIDSDSINTRVISDEANFAAPNPPTPT